MRRRFAAILIALLFHDIPALGRAAESAAPKTEEIDVTADSLAVSEAGNAIEAKGNVEVKREDTILRADEVTVNRATQEVEAKGKVSVVDPQGKLTADSVRLNLEQETGEIQNGNIFIESDHISLGGSRLQKLPGQAYHIDEGFFTTCLCESGPPTWKVTAGEIDVRPDGGGIVKRGTFYIMDVPVFYLPYGYFPLRSERQSGFLLPKIGGSSREGFKYQQPFFWAISKSSDATFSVDLETRARIGLLGEYRTVLSKDVHGQINLSYFNETLRDSDRSTIGNPTIANPDVPKDRWSVIATHRQTAPSGWMTYSDIFAFSDDLFTRELLENFNLEHAHERSLRASRYSRSQFGFLQSWRDTHLKGEWDFYQDFIQHDDRTLHKIPQVSLTGRQVLGSSPLEFRWLAEGVNYVRKRGADGLRLDLRPQIVFPFRFYHLFGAFDVAPRETLYHLYHQEDSSDRNISRELVEVRGKVGTTLSRVFAIDGSSLEKVKHVLEPQLSYLFIPHSGDDDIPLMDGADRINRRNVLTFSLINRLWGKFNQEATTRPEDQDVELLTPGATTEIQEMGRLRLALSYDVDKERKGGDSLSDLDLNLRVTPANYFALGFDTGLNPGPWQVTQGAVVASLSDPRPLQLRVADRDFMRPSHINVSYRYIRRGFLAELADNANLDVLTDEKLLRRDVLKELGVSTMYRVTDHHLLFYDSSYNARDGRFASNRFGVKVLSQCECWTAGITVNRRINPSKTTVMFEFNLLGLGSQNKDLFR